MQSLPIKQPAESISFNSSNPPTLPTYYLPHGGGPWPFMTGDFRQLFASLERALAAIPPQLSAKPSCILLISAHWEAPVITVSCAAAPGMIYDFTGFPAAMYQVQYQAPGQPKWAQRIYQLLTEANWSVAQNSNRNFDHAVYSLLQPMWPDADVPVVMMSLHTSLDAALHYRLGQSLAPLRKEGLLIIGSGQSFHNLVARGPQARVMSLLFDSWLRDSTLKLTGTAREQALLQWKQAPAARLAHPREEHLLPLMVVAGAAAEDQASCIFGDFILDVATSGFCFGHPQPEEPSSFDQLASDFHSDVATSGYSR